MSDYEMRVIEFEHARNEAMDSWFNARPDYERTREDERIFEGGFRMAWDKRKATSSCQECKGTGEIRKIETMPSGHPMNVVDACPFCVKPNAQAPLRERSAAE